MGILGGAFYFHNIALSVVKDSRNPENNVRDVFIGYVLSFLTYVTCGIMGYYGFYGVEFEQKLDDLGPPKDGVQVEMEQNCLNMFVVKNIPATIIRFCSFVQIVSV